MLLLLLPALLPLVSAESPERIPFYGFLPTSKVRALSPLGDGHPNDVYYDALPEPVAIPAGFEIRYPSHKFAFDVPQDPEEAVYIITEKGSSSSVTKDCHHHHHGKHGGVSEVNNHHHGDGRNAAATTAPPIHHTVLPSRHSTLAPSVKPSAGHGRVAPTGVPTARPTVKSPTTLPSGYFRPPPRVSPTPHVRGHLGRPQAGFRPLRPPFIHHSPSFRPARPSFAPPRGSFAHQRPPQAPPALVPGHTATPPPSRFKNLKQSRRKFPAEQYRVFPGGYARSSAYSKLSG